MAGWSEAFLGSRGLTEDAHTQDDLNFSQIKYTNRTGLPVGYDDQHLDQWIVANMGIVQPEHHLQ
jgi:hypothetical protein